MTPEACRIARGLPCATPARSVIQLAVGKARTFLQIKSDLRCRPIHH
jgi:hypothetical protein